MGQVSEDAIPLGARMMAVLNAFDNFVYRDTKSSVINSNPRNQNLGHCSVRYIPTMTRRLLIMCVCAVTVSAQDTRATEKKLLADTARRIACMRGQIKELTESTPSEDALNQACMHNCADASPKVQTDARRSRREREAKIRQLSAGIHKQIDAYVSRAVEPASFDQTTLKRTLNQLIGDGEVPAVSGSKDSLVIAYAFNVGEWMGPSGTVVAIRAYKAREGRYEFSAATGRDIDGLARLSVQKLISPKPGEIWVIASGYMTGANGPSNHMRVYAYDGTNFRTVWTAPIVWGSFNTTVTQDGFAVDGVYYRQQRHRHDRYVLGEDAVRLVPN